MKGKENAQCLLNIKLGTGDKQVTFSRAKRPTHKNKDESPAPPPQLHPQLKQHLNVLLVDSLKVMDGMTPWHLMYSLSSPLK